MDSKKPLTPLRILLVEDSEHDWAAFRRAFQRSDVSCEIARYTQAEEALDRLEADATSFDLVVTDYKLPGMSGMALCKELLERKVPLPLVIFTGVGTEHLAVEALKAGVDDYVVKDPEQGYLNLLPVVLPDVVRRYGDRLARQRAEEALYRRNRELALLNRLSWELTVTLDSGRVFQQLLEGVTEIVGTEGASVWLVVEEQENALLCQALFHHGQRHSATGLRLRSGQGIAGWVVRNGESVIIPYVPDDPRFFPGIDELTGFRTVSLLGVPLRVRGEVIGVLEAVNKREGDFDTGDLALVEMLASPAAIAIENARLYEEAQQEIAEREQAEEELRKHRDHLEELVRERTAELTVTRDAAEEARRSAEAANRAKSVFLASMSHELRTPLNAILGYAQILKRRPLDPKIIDDLDIVQQSGQHLLTLITDILDIARIEVGRMELHPAEIPFTNFLEIIAGVIRSRAEAKRLGFRFEKLNTLPPWVVADETRLRQVLLNLLGNAVKFTEQGEVVLSVEVCEYGSGGVGEYESEAPPHLHTSTLRFSVRDTGIGITPDQLEHIFQPFEQVEDVLHHTEGTGLGLAISRQLVRLMGGELHLESEAGRGSRFWFEVTLPATEVALEAALPLERVITGYRGPRRRVLVVDDIPSNRAVLIGLLEPLGFDVIQAADGWQAIQLAQELRPDLILMDRWMPLLDGFEAARRIRQIPELEEALIIAVSASVSAEDQAQSREVGINAFLPKPVNWPSLAALLAEYMKLEWEYEKQGGEGVEALAPPHPHTSAPLAPPPQEELAVLHDLALMGDMWAIRERAAHIATLGEQYVPFAERLRALAESFEERQILALIERYIEKAT